MEGNSVIKKPQDQTAPFHNNLIVTGSQDNSDLCKLLRKTLHLPFPPREFWDHEAHARPHRLMHLLQGTVGN